MATIDPDKKGRTKQLESGKRYARVRDKDGRILETFTLERVPHSDPEKAKVGQNGDVKRFIPDGSSVYPAPTGSIGMITGKNVDDVPELKALVEADAADAKSKADESAKQKSGGNAGGGASA